MSVAAPLVVLGAGPFGLAVAADALHHGIDVRVFGEPMSFWRQHMPPGMILRSASDWHLDPQGTHTIEAFLASRHLRPADVEPLRLELYLEYASWFQARTGIEVERLEVTGLDAGGPDVINVYIDSELIEARNVVLALGIQHFANVPDVLAALVPADRLVHTCCLVDLNQQRGRRCLIFGGRQSAFEWAALLREAGVQSVDVVHRHASPAFATADWSWATELAGRTERDPGWFRRLPQVDKDAIGRRMWGEGRLKVEPWLASRIDHPNVVIHPLRQVQDVTEQTDGSLLVRLDGGEELAVDTVIAATGYTPDLTKIPLLADSNALPLITTRNGSPVLDESFQTSVPGLFVTGALAIQDFGPFFGFTLAARHAAAVIGRATRERIADSAQR